MGLAKFLDVDQADVSDGVRGVGVEEHFVNELASGFLGPGLLDDGQNLEVLQVKIRPFENDFENHNLSFLIRHSPM